MRLRLKDVSPLEALPLVELAEEASKALGFDDFELVLVKKGIDLVEELGEAFTPESLDFLALHIADPEPKIIVRVESREWDLLRAVLYHEVGHAKLHGSPRFYRFSVDRKMLRGPVSPRLLYLAAIAVKDHEVSSHLARLGLEWTQRPLLELLLEPERTEWRILEGEVLRMALANISKVVMFAAPLLPRTEIERQMLDVPKRFLDPILDLAQRLTGEFEEKVVKLLNVLLEISENRRRFHERDPVETMQGK